MDSRRARWLSFVSAVTFLIALAGIAGAAGASAAGASSPQPVPAADDPDVWRHGRGPLKHPDVENLARIVGYEGGRGGANDGNDPGMIKELEHQAGAAADAITGRKTGAPPAYSGTRNLDALAIKGDTEFRSRLTKNSLTLLDAIDNRDTGFQAVLVRDARAGGRVYAIFRGTEFAVGTNSEYAKDGWADAGGIGNNQYDGDRAKLDAWAAKHTGNLVVTGHSLGCSIGQRFIADHKGDVSEAVFFNAPGIERSLAARVPCGSGPKVTYYIQPNDPVSRHGGEGHICGRVFMVEGGPTESYNPEGVFYAEHRGSMLQGSTAITEKDFGVWQRERRTAGAAVDMLDRGSKAAEALGSDLRGLAGGKTDEQLEKEEIQTRQGAYARELATGAIRLRPGVTGNDLMNAIAERGPDAGGLEDLIQKVPSVNEKAAQVAATRCPAEKSQAVWDEGLNGSSCRCEGGYRWSADHTVCEPDKEMLVAGKDCSSYGAHAEAYWSPKKSAAGCRCIDGFMPGPDGSTCTKATREWLIARADCSDPPNARPYWDEAAGKVRCKWCEPGFRWDGDRPACVEDREGQVAGFDCSSYGEHAVAYWVAKTSKPGCRCGEGSMPSADKNSCVAATREWLVARADCSGHANSRAYWDEPAGRVRCKWCDPGFRWDGDRVACLPEGPSLAGATAAGGTQDERYLKGRGTWSSPRWVKGTMTLTIDLLSGTFDCELDGTYNHLLYQVPVKARIEGRYTGGGGQGRLEGSGDGLKDVTGGDYLFPPPVDSETGRALPPRPPSEPIKVHYELRGALQGKTVTGTLGDPKTTFIVTLE